MRLTIVLPTYNEAENLPRMVEALFALPVEVDLSILVVDDNSPDGTGQIADSLAEQYPGRIKVLHRAGKEGLGKAYLAGFQKALEDGAELIIQMDCDFSHQPKYIHDMLAALPGADQLDQQGGAARQSRFAERCGKKVTVNANPLPCHWVTHWSVSWAWLPRGCSGPGGARARRACRR